jgi:DNA-binding transcriptional ArsR family regulator
MDPLPPIVAGMTNPSTIPNTALAWGYAGMLSDPDRRPHDVKSISINSITIPKRERQLDYGKVEVIARSLQSEGLLEPIGVRKLPRPAIGKFELIYGYHRLAAVQLLVQENTEETPRIAAVIFPEAMPDWACKLAEIAENMNRADLTIKEREAHTMTYAGLLKKHGLVNDADKNRSGRPKLDEPKLSVTHRESHLPSKPTTAQKVTETTGMSRQTFTRHVSRATKVAEAAGLDLKGKRGVENLSGDELIAIGEKVSQATDEERNTALKGSPRSWTSIQSDTLVSTELDTIDPKPFIEFCRRRIAGKHKPMSIDMLKVYRKALDELIQELEGAKSERPES